MNRPHSPVRSMATMVVTALAPVAVVAAYGLVGGEVPDPLPTHWNLRGQVDDSTPLLALFIATLAMSVLLTVLTGLLLRQSRQQRSDRMLVTAASWAAWLAATVFLVPVEISSGTGSAADVGMGAAAVVAVPLVPTVVAGLVWALQRVAAERRGWGYRATLHGTAAVTRRGPGLVVGRRDRTPLAVTVDHPEGAADLVNALVERVARRRSAHQ